MLGGMTLPLMLFELCNLRTALLAKVQVASSLGLRLLGRQLGALSFDWLGAILEVTLSVLPGTYPGNFRKRVFTPVRSRARTALLCFPIRPFFHGSHVRKARRR